MYDVDKILEFVKYNLGISTSVRDAYLKMIIQSTIDRTIRTGADPEGQDESYQNEWFSYIVDESAYYYRDRGGETARPPGLTDRRNSLIVERKDV